MPQSSALTRRLTQEERTDLSDRRMIECAVQLIVGRGISGTKLTEVGLRAGYSRGLAAVLAAIDAQERAIVATPGEMRALYAIFFQSSDPSAEYRVDVARGLTAQRRDLASWLREARDAGEILPGVDPVRIAGQVLSSMIGTVYQWIMDPGAPVSELHLDLKEPLGGQYGVRRRAPR